jgi:hypothetical protein
MTFPQTAGVIRGRITGTGIVQTSSIAGAISRRAPAHRIAAYCVPAHNDRSPTNPCNEF